MKFWGDRNARRCFAGVVEEWQGNKLDICRGGSFYLFAALKLAGSDSQMVAKTVIDRIKEAVRDKFGPDPGVDEITPEPRALAPQADP